MKKEKNKTIERAKTLIQKRIDALDQKVETVQEKFPVDSCGLKWMELAEKYIDEKAFLNKFLTNMNNAEKGVLAKEEERRTIFEEQAFLRDLMRTLKDYGEYSLAEKLERKVQYYDARSRI